VPDNGCPRTAPALASSWIANLEPHHDVVRAAHRAFLRTLLAERAAELGFEAWGLKEATLGIDHARYLAWLFPQARFVFLHRDPYAAYRSYSGRRLTSPWYSRWPDAPVIGARDFGSLWRRLAEGLLDGAAELDALVIRYEDLREGTTALSQLESHLDVEIDRSLLDHPVRGLPEPSRAMLGALEVRALRRAVEPVASRLGYAPW
jgi:hypothetical protein